MKPSDVVLDFLYLSTGMLTGGVMSLIILWLFAR